MTANRPSFLAWTSFFAAAALLMGLMAAPVLNVAAQIVA
jgi:hypothetical protein